MYGPEKSDRPIVPSKPANKAGCPVAELMEGRGWVDGNAELQSTVRTQSRAAVSQAQGRIREAVNRNSKEKLRGRENVHKRYLIHVAGYNLGVLMCALFGVGTPREAAVARNAFVIVIQTAEAIVIVVAVPCDAQIAALVITVAPDAA
jgi:hypothetical protein